MGESGRSRPHLRPNTDAWPSGKRPATWHGPGAPLPPWAFDQRARKTPEASLCRGQRSRPWAFQFPLTTGFRRPEHTCRFQQPALISAGQKSRRSGESIALSLVISKQHVIVIHVAHCLASGSCSPRSRAPWDPIRFIQDHRLSPRVPPPGLWHVRKGKQDNTKKKGVMVEEKKGQGYRTK